MNLDSIDPDWITRIIAVLAFIQPYLIWLWHRFFRHGKVEVYPTGRIELGFGAEGITIALLGSLIASDRNFYIQKATLNLERLKDHARQDLSWAMFRSFHISGPYASVLELPSVLKLLSDQPRPYNIVFTSTQNKQEIGDLLQPLQQRFTELTQATIKQDVNVNHTDPVAQTELYANTITKIFPEFAKTGDYNKCFEKLNRMLYWEPGQYRLNIQIEMEDELRRQSQVNRCWEFALSESDFDKLKLNLTKTIDDMLGLTNRGKYFYTTADYKPNESDALKEIKK